MKPSACSRVWPVLCALLVGCGQKDTEAADRTPATSTPLAAEVCEPAGARSVAEQLGDRLADVSLLAPASTLTQPLRETYAPFVTDELLAAWTRDPAGAPGRRVSSPWPDRIEVDSAEQVEPGVCRVHGAVVSVAAVEGSGAPQEVERDPIILRMRFEDGWRVARWEATEPTPAAAAEVVSAYYADIAAGRYRSAFERWPDEGRASGKTLEKFVADFTRMGRVVAEVGLPGRVEGAAGSRYVDVPVTVRVTNVDGETRTFTGTYALRRAVVDGATAVQRKWRIYSADLERR